MWRFFIGSTRPPGQLLGLTMKLLDLLALTERVFV